MRPGGDRGEPRAGCATVKLPGPSLPAEVATNTPASRGEEERDLDGVEVVRPGAADREVDHVDAVGDGLVDRCDAVRVGATAVAGASSQQTLYAAMRARGAMPLILPKARRHPLPGCRCCRRPSTPCGCRGRCSRAARGSPARRSSTPKPALKNCAPISFLLQSESGEALARRAAILLEPTRERAPSRFPLAAGRRPAVGEARMVRHDPRVDDADDDALARVADAAELAPRASRAGQAHEVGRVRRVAGHLVLLDRDHGRILRERLRLALSQLGREAVVGRSGSRTSSRADLLGDIRHACRRGSPRT